MTAAHADAEHESMQAPDRDSPTAATVTFVCRACGGRQDHFVPDPDALADWRIDYCPLCESVKPMDVTEGI